MTPQKSVRILTARKHKHDGEWKMLDDEYETDEENAANLVAMGYATRVIEAKKNAYRRRDLQVEE